MSTLRVDNFTPSAGGTDISINGINKAYGFVDQTVGLGAESLNITSATDVGVGRWNLTLTNILLVADSPRTMAGDLNSFINAGFYTNDYSTTTLNVLGYDAGSFADTINISIAAQGRLA